MKDIDPKRDYAKFLKRHATKAERVLWTYLRDRRLGVNFRFQHVCFGYIADFACPLSKLVVEVDGGVHRTEYQAQYDIVRDQALARKGWTTIRFSNQEVFYRRKFVLDRICEVLGVSKVAGVRNEKELTDGSCQLKAFGPRKANLTTLAQCAAQRPRLVQLAR